MQNRREFIKSAGLGFFALGFTFPGGKLVARYLRDTEHSSLNQFIAIGTDNSVTLYNHRPEMGQGTFTSIPMILAEELGVEMDRVTVKQAPANRELYGSQMVVGSRSIQTEYEKLRKMGAAAREMLMRAAADTWETEVSDCRVEDGRIIHSTGMELSYGELVESAAALTPPASPQLKDPESFGIIGTPVARRDIPSKTDGSAQFGLDVSVPGMLYASVARSPVFLGEVKEFNEAEILKLPGVKHVMKTSRTVYDRKREGVAVLAETYWQATNAREKLRITWDNLGLEQVSGSSLREDYIAESDKDGDVLFSRGSFEFQSGWTEMSAIYETPYQAHVPMEPMNAIVHIEDNRAAFWGSTQNPNGIRSFISERYGITPENIAINYTYMGGGFGRRSMTDVVEEAADLSSKAGAPVKVVWSREDDLTQGPFRACSINRMRAGLDSGGNVQFFEHKVVAQQIRNQTGDNMTAGQQLMGGITTDYIIPNLVVRGVLQKRHVPISYWRAVYHSTNPFAHECFVDELAHAAGKDPMDFRLGLMEHPRFVRVLKKVREVSGWDQKADGTGKGVAIAERSGAYFAMVIEVQNRNGKVLPARVVTAVDVGTCINPDTVKAQIEGSVVMGLGAAYYGLTLQDGGIKETNFHEYPLLRIDQTPEIETHIISSFDPPDGAGEAGLPTVAPALVNAIFDLTGERLRKLPLEKRFIS